jgi:outer membrane receptor protein involved in Fe transport
MKLNYSKLLLTASAGALLLASQAYAQEEGAEVGEVVVTASRVARSGFTAPTPTTVLGQDVVQQRGATNITEVINETPAFRPSATAAAAARGGSSSGGSFLDLRGLNGQGATTVARTLVLVNGRRHVPSNPGGVVDINMIPSSLIERTEVVTGGASAAWGSDAVSGVVNLILKNRLNGIEGAVGYGQSDENDFKEYSFNIAAGSSFANGKGHVIAGFEYVDNKGVADASVSRDWGRMNYATLTLNTPRAAGLPARILLPNVVASDRMSNGGVIVGGPLDNIEFCGGQCTRIFTPGAFVGGNQMSGFGANNSNVGVTLLGGSNLVNPIERYSGLVRSEWEFSSKLTGFVEFSHAESKFHGTTAQRRDDASLTIRQDNAFLPESVRQQMIANNLQTITVGRVANDPGYSNYPTRTKQQGDRLAFGFEGTIGKWKWDTYYQWGRNNYVQLNDGTLNSNYTAAIDAVRDAGGNIVCRPGAALNAADPGCVPFNIFGQGSPSAAAIDYVLGTMVNDVTTKQQVAAFNLSGDVFNLPAGPVSVAAGVEYRKEEVSSQVDDRSLASRWDLNNYKPINGSYNTKEVYGEIVVPILRDVVMFDSLDLNAAVRRTDYSTSGPVTTWKVGGTWDVVRDIRFRATKSRDIRAPNLRELFSPVVQTRGNISNPFIGGTAQQDILTSGNPNLVPERANTFTAGVVLQPRWIPGLRFSADYFDIKINDVITQLAAQEIVNRCFAGVQTLCDDITFTNGRNITQVRNRQQNFASLDTSGWDFEFSYRLPRPVFGGDLSFRALGSFVADLTTTDSTGVVDRAKQTVPEWSWNVSANYDIGKFGLNLQARYIGPTTIDVTLREPGDPDYNAASTNSVSVNSRPGFTYWNMSVQYRLIDEPGRRLQLFGVVNNIFDLDPPLGSPGNQTGPSLYDLVGRSFRVGARFNY